jgi:hypothetical protein
MTASGVMNTPWRRSSGPGGNHIAYARYGTFRACLSWISLRGM